MYPDEYKPSTIEFHDDENPKDAFGDPIKEHNQTRLLKRFIGRTKPEKCDKIATVYHLNTEADTYFKMPSDGYALIIT